MEYEAFTPEAQLELLRERLLLNEREHYTHRFLEKSYVQVRSRANEVAKAAQKTSPRQQSSKELMAKANKQVTDSAMVQVELEAAIEQLKAEIAELEPIVEQRAAEREAEREAEEARAAEEADQQELEA